LNPYEIQVCDLSGEDGDWANVPANGSPYMACIDPELGRIALTTPLAVSPPGSAVPQLQASFYYGFNGDMGGGEYPRSDSFTVQTETSVLEFPDRISPPRYSSLQDALNFAAENLDENGQAAVEITSSGIYPVTRSTALQIGVPPGATIELRAADGCRPTLLLAGEILIIGGPASTFNLNGLVIAYEPPSVATGFPPALLHVPDGSNNDLGNLGLTHCTLVPGWALTPGGEPQPPYLGLPTLLVESSMVQVTIRKSIVGGLQINQQATANLTDSIVDARDQAGVAYADVDGTSGGGSLTLQTCTVVGKIHATLFALVSDSIVWARLAAGDSWTAPVLSDRKQEGCVRFSYFPAGSVVPRQFQCAGLGMGGPPPIFYSLRYGDPGYAKLVPSTDGSIRQGADDGGEMGAFHFVLAPLRENDLQVRLQEYLPVGLEFGIFYQT
jgi:hypothetical protein